jgi:L-asparaginase
MTLGAVTRRLVLALLITKAVLTPALAQPGPGGRQRDARAAGDAPAGDADPAARSKVRLIATGGTISNRTGGRLTADELLKSVPALDRYVRAEAEQFANVASSELTVAQWLELARRINELFQQDSDLSGVVVTSGTDTLEETAYFLNLAVRTDKPVVVAGSMRNPSTLGYEGAANLLQAFRVAAEPASRGKGVLVVLNDEINAAREATKTDALRLQTFQSRGYGLLGVVDSDRVVYYRTGVKRHTAASEFDVASLKELPRVDVIMVYQGASGDLIKAAVDQGAKGIVIASAGAGATSGTQREGIQYAVDKGVFVVTSTRTGSGRIAAGRRGRGAAGNARPDTGYRIAAEDLAPLKARVLLMLALAARADGAAIQRMFTEY